MIGLVDLAQGETLSVLWWAVQFWFRDDPVWDDEVPIPPLTWGWIVRPADVTPPSPVAAPNEDWMWWEASAWTPVSWPIQYEGSTMWQSTWVTPATTDTVRQTTVQRRAEEASTLSISWDTGEPTYPLVWPSIGVSAWIKEPV